MPADLYWLIIVFMTGSIAGSFLNVLITRLPDMILHQRTDVTLTTPRSFCPHCKRTLRIRDLVPLLSYLALRGHCSFCRGRIPFGYFLLEVAAGLIAVGAWLLLPDPTTALACAILGWGLLALSIIDWQTRLLPDLIVYPLLWLGLLLNLNGTFVALSDAVIGAVAGYLALWFLYHLFRLLTGESGMGHGDFKLFAVCGAWLGWMQLPWIALIASMLTLTFWLLQTLRGHPSRMLAFGPALSLALAVLLLYPTSTEHLAGWLSPT